MREVLPTLRFKDVAEIAERLFKQVLERVHLSEMGDWPAGVGIGEPDAVIDAEPRMAIHRQAEPARQEFPRNDLAYSLILGLHGLAQFTAKPGQPGTVSLTPDQPRYVLSRFHRSIPHEVDTIGIGPSSTPDTARVHERHEHQSHRLQLPVQGVVPFQTRGKVLQVGHDDLGTNSLQAMNPAEKTNGGESWIWIAQRHDLNRHALPATGYFADRAGLEVGATHVDDPGQVVEMRQSLHGLDYEGCMERTMPELDP